MPDKSLEQWQIWDVEWLHEDGTSKRRPALLISSTQQNNSQGYGWFAKLSTVKHETPYRVDLPATVTGLNKDSYLYVNRVQKIRHTEVYKLRSKLPLMARLMIDSLIQRASTIAKPN